MDTMELEGRIEEMRKEVEFHYHRSAVSTRLVDRRGALFHEQLARSLEEVLTGEEAEVSHGQDH